MLQNFDAGFAGTSRTTGRNIGCSCFGHRLIIDFDSIAEGSAFQGTCSIAQRYRHTVLDEICDRIAGVRIGKKRVFRLACQGRIVYRQIGIGVRNLQIICISELVSAFIDFNYKVIDTGISIFYRVIFFNYRDLMLYFHLCRLRISPYSSVLYLQRASCCQSILIHLLNRILILDMQEIADMVVPVITTRFIYKCRLRNAECNCSSTYSSIDIYRIIVVSILASMCQLLMEELNVAVVCKDIRIVRVVICQITIIKSICYL